MDLTNLEQIAFESLLKYEEAEEVYMYCPIPGKAWHVVYLDNAKPNDWNGKQWAGVLSRLASKGTKWGKSIWDNLNSSLDFDRGCTLVIRDVVFFLTVSKW